MRIEGHDGHDGHRAAEVKARRSRHAALAAGAMATPVSARPAGPISALVGLVGVAALALLPPTAAFAAVPCHISRFELPVTMVGLRPTVAARINGIEVRFTVDSGAAFSMIAPAAADRLGLVQTMAPWGLFMDGVGGSIDIHIARVEHFEINKLEVPRLPFIVGGNEVGANTVGLLGQNFLGLWDVEYDLAHGAVRLMRIAGDCDDTNLAYWAGDKPVIVLDLERLRGQKHTLAEAEINGRKLRALLDTGAAGSLLSKSAARRAGIVPGGPDVVAGGPLRGAGSALVPSWIGPVTSFKIGGETIRNTRIRFADIDLQNIDLLLGADFMVSHRIYVSNAQRKIYMTYEGGQVFAIALPPRVAPAASAPDASEADAETPGDADGYTRRGAAHASRREFELALADLDRACAMDPQAAAAFRLRARVQRELHRADRALAEYGTAIGLQPADAEARIERAELLLSRGDRSAALIDLGAAQQALAPQDDLHREVGDLLLGAQRPELALAQYDLWIAAHREEVTLPAVQARRCWTRLLLGTEIDKARRDCRDALHVEPKLALALYGRGLIELREGATAAGNADLAAARALDPGIEAAARRGGIAPAAPASAASAAPAT